MSCQSPLPRAARKKASAQMTARNITPAVKRHAAREAIKHRNTLNLSHIAPMSQHRSKMRKENVCHHQGVHKIATDAIQNRRTHPPRSTSLFAPVLYAVRAIDANFETRGSPKTSSKELNLGSADHSHILGVEKRRAAGGKDPPATARSSASARTAMPVVPSGSWKDSVDVLLTRCRAHCRALCHADGGWRRCCLRLQLLHGDGCSLGGRKNNRSLDHPCCA